MQVLKGGIRIVTPPQFEAMLLAHGGPHQHRYLGQVLTQARVSDCLTDHGGKPAGGRRGMSPPPSGRSSI
ncbi:hypothetical protein Sgou_05340 [Streptomyces gougerotii]|uniref:DUF5753 domain-containing protein n=1 Tax=Streptomyces gougerotii TaxID=53448 RepID=A0ABQ1D0B4_9ACTN|nr:hypothetical protein Sgou_05340 [Streptomyces gougerotii]